MFVPFFSAGLECLISDSLQILPFMGNNGYGFRETCEFELVTACPSISSPDVPISIVVDYRNDNFEMGQVGIMWRDELVVINEDNSLSSSGTSSGEITTFSNSTLILVEIEAAGVSVEKRLGVDPSLSVTVSNTSDLASQLCGLCGDRQGNLRLKNGQTTDVEAEFVAEYKVEPPILMRQECGKYVACSLRVARLLSMVNCPPSATRVAQTIKWRQIH